MNEQRSADPKLFEKGTKLWWKGGRYGYEGRMLGHKDRNYAGPQLHYAYCLRCGRLFGNVWGGRSK